MSDALVQRVHEALGRVVDPCSIATGVPITLADMGLLETVAVDGREVHIRLRVTSPFCMQIGIMQERIRAVLRDVRGIDAVHLEVDDGTTWLPSMMAPDAQRRLRAVRPIAPAADERSQPAGSRATARTPEASRSSAVRVNFTRGRFWSSPAAFSARSIRSQPG